MYNQLEVTFKNMYGKMPTKKELAQFVKYFRGNGTYFPRSEQKEKEEETKKEYDWMDSFTFGNALRNQ